MRGADSDSEHERALMRSFELRHPLLALCLRMVRNRPVTGSVMAIAFAATSLILYEGIKLADKRLSTWTEVNFVGNWQAHDREKVIRQAAAQDEDLDVHEDAPIPISPGQHVPVMFERYEGHSNWYKLPDADELNSNDPAVLQYKRMAWFTLPPGDKIAVFRKKDGSAAELTIRGTDYVLAHAIWDGPSAKYPDDIREADRESSCSDFAPANCTIYGFITKQQFKALGFPEKGTPAPGGDP